MLLGSTRMENHPDGTGDLNSILNGNWGVINSMFNPAYGINASQSLFVVTAVSSVFKLEMVGATIKWTDGHLAIITVYTDPTHVTVSVSQTVTAQAFEVYRSDVIQTPYDLLARGLTKNTIISPQADNCLLRWDDSIRRYVFLHPSEIITPVFSGSAATVAIDADAGYMTIIPVTTGALTLTLGASVNMYQGMQRRIIIQKGSGGALTLVFPGGWTFIGSAAPASLAASKTMIITLFSTTTADSGILATWLVQP